MGVMFVAVTAFVVAKGGGMDDARRLVDHLSAGSPAPGGSLEDVWTELHDAWEATHRPGR